MYVEALASVFLKRAIRLLTYRDHNNLIETTRAKKIANYIFKLVVYDVEYSYNGESIPNKISRKPCLKKTFVDFEFKRYDTLSIIVL